MSELIEPRLLKGFRDFLPDQEAERQRIQRILEQTFSSFGFVPIDTPILEYAEILLGKSGGETDRQIYRFHDQGRRDVAMRMDLTIPFARFMAAHQNELYLPFKRFHIGKAFRGENTQRGRYREFVQCDFDIVGTESISSDLEIVLLMDYSFRAMGVEKVVIHIADRSVFNDFLTQIGITGSTEEILRIVDKLRKLGVHKIGRLLSDLVGTDRTDSILRYISPGKDNDSTLESMSRLAPGSPGIDRLRTILNVSHEVGVADRLVIDPSITRGLDYYTGIVFETFLSDLPEIGSVCSGGRYDNLASLYTKERLPGVGASIGLDRLMAALQELGLVTSSQPGADAVVLCLDDSLLGHYHLIAAEIRSAGLRVDVYPEQRKLGQQFAFAERKGIPAAIICGETERQAGTLNVRNLSTRESEDGLTIEQGVTAIRRIVAGE